MQLDTVTVNSHWYLNSSFWIYTLSVGRDVKHNCGDEMAENHHSTLISSRSAKVTKVVPFETNDNESNIIESNRHEKTPVYKALYSLKVSLLLGGLVFRKDFSKSGIKRHLTVSHVYSSIVLLFLSFNVLRWLTMFQGDEKFGVQLFMKIVVCIWGLKTLALYISFFLACESFKRLPEFFMEWEKIRINCSTYLISITRISKICTAILWTISISNSIFSAYLIFCTDIQNMTLAPWDENFRYAFVVRIINTIQQAYLSICWSASSALLFTICKILAHEFHKVTSSIKKLAEADPEQLMTDLETIRQKHQKLCDLVVNADDIFSMQIAYSFLGCLLIACLMMYIVIYDDSEYQNMQLVFMVEVFWVIAPIVKVIVDCVAGAILNGAVRAYHPANWRSRSVTVCFTCAKCCVPAQN